MADYYRAVLKYLKEHDCEFLRQGNGDHEIWRSPINNRQFTLPTTLPVRHTANGVLKDAGINEKV